MVRSNDASDVSNSMDPKKKKKKSWSILMISSDPTSHHKLKLQAEERAIRKCLQSASQNHVDIQFEVLPAATIDDVAEKLLHKSSSGSSYDILHFSGHCDQHHHMVQLIFSELEKQHGPEVLNRFKSSHDATKGIHELAVQVSRHLEVQAAMYMDELYCGQHESDEQGMELSDEESEFEAAVQQESEYQVDEDQNSDDSLEPFGCDEISNHELRPDQPQKQQDTATEPQETTTKHTWRTSRPACRPRSKSFDNLTISVENDSTWRDLRPSRSENRQGACEKKKRRNSLSPMFRVHMKRKPSSDIVQETRADEHQLLVFSPKRRGNQTGHEPSPSTDHESYPKRFPSDQDSLVLRLPDVDPAKLRFRRAASTGAIPDEDEVVPTRDIVLTKRQILDAGVGSLAFETGTGQGMNFVGAKAFAALLSPYALDLDCVLLNACSSQLVCEQVLSVGAPLAICSRGRMSDKSALHFSQGFYDAIAAGMDIERAFLEGQNRIAVHTHKTGVQGHSSNVLVSGSLSGPPGVDEWENQVCLMRANGKMVLNPVSVRQHQRVFAENARLKNMIQEGVKILSEKDREIEELKAKLKKLERLEQEAAAVRRSNSYSTSFRSSSSSSSFAATRSNGVGFARSTNRSSRESGVRLRPQSSSSSNAVGSPFLRGSNATVSKGRSTRTRDGKHVPKSTKGTSSTQEPSVSSSSSPRTTNRKQQQQSLQQALEDGVSKSCSALPPWIPAGSGGESHRHQQQSFGKENHASNKQSRGPKTSSRSTTVFTTLSVQQSQAQQQAPKPSGFGSSVPRFDLSSALDPTRYETTSSSGAHS